MAFKNSGAVADLKAKQIVSSGGVIFRSAPTLEVALISRWERWYLPKGLIEIGETAETTALREVREETGLEGEIVKKLGKITYSFKRKELFFKTVHFYLMKYIRGTIENHDFEADKVAWFTIPDAIQALTYINEKKIVEEAQSALGKLDKSKSLHKDDVGT